MLSKVPYATRRDGWEVARTTTKGDVVFIDPTYLGVQAYGGNKDNVTSRDANDVKEAIQKLADLAKTTIENGFSIVYTNEFSDKSKKKKPGFSRFSTHKSGTKPCAKSAERTRASPTSRA